MSHPHDISTHPLPHEETVRLRQRAVLICIAVTAFVAVIELTFGILFGFISITAEGLHTSADLADSLAALMLVTWASRPADRTHPFGHGKFDSMAALIEGTFVGATAVWAIYRSLQVILGFEETQPQPGWPVLIAMAVSSIVYITTSRYLLKLADRTRSPAVRAEALHLFSHVYITVGLLAGVGLAQGLVVLGMEAALPYADSTMGLILGIALLGLAVHIMKPGVEQLTDKAIPDEEIHRIVEVFESFKHEFVEIHALRTRAAGTDTHVDVHLVVEGYRMVQSAHELSHRIEMRLLERFPQLMLMIHIEPASERMMRDHATREGVGIIRPLVDGDPLQNESDHHEHESMHGHRLTGAGT